MCKNVPKQWIKMVRILRKKMGFRFQTKAQKWKKSILSGRFSEPYGKAGDQCRIRESWKGRFANPPFPPARVNFPPSCVTSIEWYYPISELNYKHLKNKQLFSVYEDNIFPFVREFNLFCREELQDYLEFWTVTKNVTHEVTRQQSWSWPGW